MALTSLTPSTTSGYPLCQSQHSNEDFVAAHVSIVAQDLRGRRADEEAAVLPLNADAHLLGVFILGVSSGLLRKRSSGASARDVLPGVLEWIDTYTLVRCGRLRKRFRAMATVGYVWEPRVRALCTTWCLECPSLKTWRKSFLSLLRPRLDGIYVGECRVKNKFPPGSSADLRMNHRTYTYATYLRCVRFCPPCADDGSGHALVLRNAVPFEVAAKALVHVDPELQVARQGMLNADARCQNQVAVGRYTFEGSQISISVQETNSVESLSIAFKLRHASDASFSGELLWMDYSKLEKDGELTRFDLGRTKSGDGDPRNADKDHFPPLRFRPWPHLEYLL